MQKIGRSILILLFLCIKKYKIWKKSDNINMKLQENKITKKVLIGFIAGIISGLFAAGGGMIVVPALIHLFNLNDSKARATSILAILPMVVTSGIFYYKGNYINWSLGIKCAIGGIIGGIIGAKLLKKIPEKILRILFIIFLIYTSAKMIMS